MSKLFEIDPWHLMTGKWEKSKSLDYRKALTLSNSVMTIDGAFEEDESRAKLQNIWRAEPSSTIIGYQGTQPFFIDLKKIEILFNEQKLDWENDQIEDLTIDLDLHNGLLSRTFTLNRSDVLVKVKFERFLSVAKPELLVERVEILNFGSKAVKVEIHACLDAGDTSKSDWEILELNTQQATGSITMIMKPNQFGTPRFMAGAMAHHLTELRSVGNPDFSSSKAENWFRGELSPNQRVFFEKRVVVTTSLKSASDREIKEQLISQSNELDNFTFDDLLDQNDIAWQKKYKLTDIKIAGDPALQQIIRAANFRFLQVEDPILPLSWLDEAISIPAWLESGLTSSAKKTLDMRFKQLPNLVKNAKSIGGYGVFLPALTFDGNESLDNEDVSLFGIHRTCALVYAIAQYLAFTNDQKWLNEVGRHLLLESANFLHQRVQYSEYREQYVVLGVSGPDEYQFNVNNNWLTNYLIKWDLNYILHTIPQEFDEELSKKLNDIVEKIYLPNINVNGKSIKIEDDAFLQKDLSFTAKKLTIFDRPVSEKWTKDKIARSPIANQPDVFWGFYYLPEDFTVDDIRDNFEFYNKYLAHETEISRGLTALTAALAGNINYAKELIIEDNKNFTTKTCTKSALTRSVIIHGFLGLQIVEDSLILKPKIPDDLLFYELTISYKGRLIDVKVEADCCKVFLKQGLDLIVKVNNQSKLLLVGQSETFALN